MSGKVKTPTFSLKTCSVTGGGHEPHLLITAGIHGDEFEGMEAVRRLKTTLSSISFRGRVTLVPVVNEPAFLRGQRCAEDGLDLARRCPGDAAGSVTDRIADALTQLIRTADYYIDLHSGGVASTVAPLAGYMLHPEVDVLNIQRRMASAFNLPLVWGTSATLQGRSLSVARDSKIPAIYTEYLGGGLCSPEGIDAYHEGCLNVMRELDMAPRHAPPNRVVRSVEDWQDDSGHLQSTHLAPLAGFFQSAVKLGQAVQAGDLIGRVVDVLGEECQDILAEQSGIVICLASFPRVLAGSSLAVVLDPTLTTNAGASGRPAGKDSA